MHKFKVLLILVIFVLGFWVRLYKIDNPVADWHSWRQADTASVTRMFVQHGVNMFVPRYFDMSPVAEGGGMFNPSGYRMVEFPIFNLIHYSLYSLMPDRSLEFWGRMTAVLSSMASAVFILAITRRYTRDAIAILATAIFLFLPYNIYFSRVILPEPLMVALYLGALNFFDLWMRQSKSRDLVVTGIFAVLAVLVKPVAAFFLIPMAWQARSRLKDIRLYWLGAGIVVPLFLWRLWIGMFPEGIPMHLWLLNGNGIRFKGAFFRWLFGERLGSLILGKWGIFPFLSGLVALKSYFVMWLLGGLIYLVVFATGNVHHDYYQIPLIPVVAITVAIGVGQLWKSFKTGVLAVVCLLFMFGLTWYDIRGNYQINQGDIISAGAAVQRIVPADAVIVAKYGGDTAFLYQTGRRGFTHLPLPINELMDRFGVSYYVSVNYDDNTNAIMNQYTIVEKTRGYVIVRLQEK